MTERPVQVSPQAYARVGGLLYLVIFVMAAVSMGLQSRMIVPGDPAATASHIAASQMQWRLSIGAELIMFTCDIPLAAIFFVLLRPVNPTLALLSALFRFAEAVVGSVIVLLHYLPVMLLGGAAYLNGLEPQQLQASALLSIKLYDYGFGVALIPFGLHCVTLGYLLFRSTYLPKTLGVLMAIAGVCYTINSFALFIAPKLAGPTFIALVVSGLPAELGLCLWLLVMGVNVPKWNGTIAAMANRDAALI
jgi:Domain of unknown function (DUF4386)